CNECGKKFSRSDNLAQHARTHGSGAIALNLIDDVDGLAAGSYAPHPHSMYAVATAAAAGREDFTSFGKVLFQLSAEIPGSASELSSDEGLADAHGKKKRKRAD